MSTFKPTAPAKPEIPRRVVEIPNAPPRRTALTGTELPQGDTASAPADEAAQPATDTRKLIVGRDISLTGEITDCDVLVVEGTVEAKLKDGRLIEIAQTGLFKGSVEIHEADIAGRFDGDLTVRGQLLVRASGVINGSVQYGTLEVESGGRLIGTLAVLDGSVRLAAAPQPGATESAAAKPAAFAPMRESAE